MIVFLIYIAIFVASYLLVKFVLHKTVTDYTSLKTVTFGDESAVTPNPGRQRGVRAVDFSAVGRFHRL